MAVDNFSSGLETACHDDHGAGPRPARCRLLERRRADGWHDGRSAVSRHGDVLLGATVGESRQDEDSARRPHAPLLGGQALTVVAILQLWEQGSSASTTGSAVRQRLGRQQRRCTIRHVLTTPAASQAHQAFDADCRTTRSSRTSRRRRLGRAPRRLPPVSGWKILGDRRAGRRPPIDRYLREGVRPIGIENMRLGIPGAIHARRAVAPVY
jgi:hypothetical protein